MSAARPPDAATGRASFLAAVGWGDAPAEPLAGDASARRYLRLGRRDGARAVLMEAAPDPSFAAFITITALLRRAGLSAPRILARDDEGGRLLLEDFGDRTFPVLLDAFPSRARELYGSAAEALASLQRIAPPPGLVAQTPDHLAGQVAPLFSHYAPDRQAHAEALYMTLGEALDGLPPSVLVHRDFHAGNLVWLPRRRGVRRVGLLDYQDAMTGHPAYDLASLLRDVRRDVPPEAAADARRRFLDASGHAAAGFERALRLLALQRNLRILGLFARLCLEGGKPAYLAHMPRVWRLLEEDLAVPGLDRLRRLVETAVPPPTPALIESFRRRCPVPMPS